MFNDLSLNPRLLQALEDLRLSAPTEVQTRAIPLAMTGDDLMVSAETGSGKTLAYLLPTLNQLLAKRARRAGTRALVLLPTRELAKQVATVCERLVSHTDLTVTLITGGIDPKPQIEPLKEGVDIVIATPGRLLDHLNRGIPENFSDVEVLILDEADRMLDMGFAESVDRISDTCTASHQTLLFSATLKQRGVMQMAQQILLEPQMLELNQSHDRSATIKQQIVLADDLPHKERLIVGLIEQTPHTKALVFCNSKAQADKLGGILRHNNIRAGVLHGDMAADIRENVMGQLHSGKIKVLAASDIAARGLDVRDIDLVVNFDMARTRSDYIHRIGRTGRAGEQGLAVSLIAPQEWNLMISIERSQYGKFERRVLEGLKGSYTGPKKQKKSGKAAGSKKHKVKRKEEKTTVKKRLRDKKNIGKRRKPTAKPEQ